MHSGSQAASTPAPATSSTTRARLRRVVRLFATPLQPSHYLELFNPLWATHALRARVERVQAETAEARTLTLRPGRGWRQHRPGQYVALGVTIDGVRQTRTYSITSAPHAADGCFRITVKAIAGGRVSRFLVRDLQPGAVVALGQPQGDFVLPDAAPAGLLFITAGSGITPVMSMLRDAAARGAVPDAVHLHYAPAATEVIFADELRRLREREARYRLHLAYTRNAATASRHFSAAQLGGICPDWRAREVWACGPPALLAAIEAHWAAAGLGQRLHIERFVTPRAVATPPGVGGTVRFAASRRAAQGDAHTPLLHVAEGIGLSPPYGCRMGICHTCDTPLLAGCVRDLRNGAVLSAGQKVQLCVCAAAGDVDLAL